MHITKKVIQRHLKNIHSFIKSYKHFIILAYAIFILFIPFKSFYFGNLHYVIYFLFVPALIIILLFGEKISEYGFTIGDWRKALLFTAAFTILSVCIVFLSIRYIPDLQSYYSNSSLYSGGIITLILLIIGWEFIFRGFLLFGLKDKVGDLNANIIQAILFFFAHIGKPSAELYSTLFTGLIFGYICLKSKSFFPMVVIHLAIFFSAFYFASL